MCKFNFNCNMEDNNNIVDKGNNNALMVIEKEMDEETISIDEVRKSDFSFVFDDFFSCGMSYSNSLDYETIDLLGKIYYKGKLVDSFGCLYCDATGESVVTDENNVVNYILVDREFLEQVMRQYMSAVLSKVYGSRGDYKPESRVSKVFEGLHCALCQDGDFTFMVYADDEDELYEMDMDEAVAKRFIDNDKVSDLIYISEEGDCDKVRLYF